MLLDALWGGRVYVVFLLHTATDYVEQFCCDGILT